MAHVASDNGLSSLRGCSRKKSETSGYVSYSLNSIKGLYR